MNDRKKYKAFILPGGGVGMEEFFDRVEIIVYYFIMERASALI